MIPFRAMSSDSIQGKLSGLTGCWKVQRVQTCHLLNPSFGNVPFALGLKNTHHVGRERRQDSEDGWHVHGPNCLVLGLILSISYSNFFIEKTVNLSKVN